MPRVRVVTVETQRAALVKAAKMAADGSVMRKVRDAALIITSDVKKNDGEGQLQAIYDAVKEGHPDVRGLERGVKYVRDPVLVDFFTAPARLLSECENDGRKCAEDCDGHAMLVASLCAAIGLRAGLRAFKPDGKKIFTHVYAVAAPELMGSDGAPRLIGMDTTIDRAYPGWEPRPGKTMTILLEDFAIDPMKAESDA